jgi:nucleoside-diphosphate-sugar epimerase
MQTILGSGGAVGTELTRALTNYTKQIRLVSRNPKKVNPDDELFPVDLTNPPEVEKAIEGSEIVYVTIGFEYNTKAWQQKWPPFIKSVIEGCKKSGSKLVFFDNMYMYDPDYLADMTEETPIRPLSVKGQIRKQVAEKILEAMKAGSLTALIARAPDFMAPTNSILTESVYRNLKKGKKANWLANGDRIHNFIYYVDAGKATAMLGNTPDAYNQVWHLPSLKEKLTGKQWAELFAKQMNVKGGISVLPSWMMPLVGLFVPIMKELKEMVYQFDRDYYFNSRKFEDRFSYKPFSAEEAVTALIDVLEK